MLEGKEIDIKIGEYGLASVDLDSKMNLTFEIKVDLISVLKTLALKTNTQVDDNAIKWIESLIKK